MDETYIENIKKIQDSIKPVQAIADSLTPVQTAVNNFTASQTVSYSFDFNSVHAAASSIVENVERANEAIAEQKEYITERYDLFFDDDIICDSTNIENQINAAVTAAEQCAVTLKIIREELNLSNIVSAVMKTVDLFAGINKFYVDLYEYTREKFHDVLHNLFHWLIAQFNNFSEKIKKGKTHCIALETKRVLSLCPNPCIKALIIDFHEHTISLRKSYMLRHQNRGDDSSDNYCFIEVTLLTMQ